MWFISLNCTSVCSLSKPRDIHKSLQRTLPKLTRRNTDHSLCSLLLALCYGLFATCSLSPVTGQTPSMTTARLTRGKTTGPWTILFNPQTIWLWIKLLPSYNICDTKVQKGCGSEWTDGFHVTVQLIKWTITLTPCQTCHQVLKSKSGKHSPCYILS